MVRTACAMVAAAVVLAVPAHADATVTLTGDSATRGYVSLQATASDSVPITIVEQVDGREEPVGVDQTGPAARAYSRWTCARSVRTFVADAAGERSAPVTVTTPTCAQRLKVFTRGRVDQNGILRVTVRDRWRIGGVSAQLCVLRPGGTEDCQTLDIPPDLFDTSRVFAATDLGTWTVDVATLEQLVTRSVVVRRPPPVAAAKPVLLTTGDSMMLTTSAALRRRLDATTDVVSDVYVGSGITRPFVVDWTNLPAAQVRADHPDAVVATLGQGEGYPLDGVACCEEPWVAAYAAHVRALMETYAQGGRTRVVWLTVPYPRDPARAPVIAAVNAAIPRAAAGLPSVRIVDLAARFTPTGVFRRRVEGVVARSADGVHLSRAGADIAARLILPALKP